MAIIKKRACRKLDRIQTTLPLSVKGKREVKKHRRDIASILNREDNRFLVVVGPCSAWPKRAVVEYAQRLAPLAHTYRDRLKIVMRVYTQKPRTTKGWAGVIVQPNPFVPANVEKGVLAVRTMMLEVADLGLPIADELLFTHKAEWIGDLVSWFAIGARSAEDQEHRVFASGLAVPVGMKNPTSGDLATGVNSVVSAQSPHTYYAHGYEVQTDGNPFAHLVLRGGISGVNYKAQHVDTVRTLYKAAGIKRAAVLVDASHDNTRHSGVKDHTRQVDVVRAVLRARTKCDAYREMVRGVCIESFLKDGNQSLTTQTDKTIDRDGCSITDPCLGWEDTDTLLRYIYNHTQ